MYHKIKNSLSLAGLITLTISGHSMLPLIQERDSINIIPCIPEKLKMFDIVVLWDNEKLICHYLWKKNNGLVKRAYTRALNPLNSKLDSPVEFYFILGAVENYKIKKGTKLRILIQSILKI